MTAMVTTPSRVSATTKEWPTILSSKAPSPSSNTSLYQPSYYYLCQQSTEEKINLLSAYSGLHPLDISFSPDPNLDNSTIPQCRYSNIGMNYTITGPQVSSSSHTDVPSQVMAIAELHLWKRERGKLLQLGKTVLYTQMSLTGKDVIHSLNNKGIILISAVIDPHGKWVTMFDSLLVGYR